MTPADLPAFYRDLFEERAALMQEGSRLTYAEANRAAMADILRVMDRDLREAAK